MAAALDAVVEASADGRPPTLPKAADGLADEVTLMGTYADAGDAIAAWFRAGADAVNLTLPPGRPEAELIEIVDTAAEVRRNTVGGRAAA
jgi:alkanesulfonate monooxygenase SsuD/methylene tetrahydromethanopterin reductase-like flavin-dependent oxidoreductase (luciferase family)